MKTAGNYFTPVTDIFHVIIPNYLARQQSELYLKFIFKVVTSNECYVISKITIYVSIYERNVSI